MNSISTLAAYGGASSARTVDHKEAAGTSGNSVGDRVEISERGTLLSKATLTAPSWDRVKQFKNDFSAALSRTLKEAAIKSNPPLVITQADDGTFSVTGDNPEAGRVQDLLNGSDELKMLHHSMQAIASHMPRLEESMRFQREYRAANGADAVQRVVAKYSSLLSGVSAHHSFTTVYGSQGAVLQMDGRKVA